ncbi:asparagine synthetase B, partial [Brachybacterium hainanense]
ITAARRNAARFGILVILPLLNTAVRAALRADARTDPAAALEALGPLANPSAAATRPEHPAAIDLEAWTSRLKGMLHQVFRSEQFARRGWADQRAVLEAFEDHIAGRSVGGAPVFWRLFLLELWMREVVEADPDAPEPETGEPLSLEDDHGRFDEPEPKDPLAANAGKDLDLELADAEGGTVARRYPIRTGKFAADTPMDPEIRRYVVDFFTALDAALEDEGPEARDHRDATLGRSWNLTVSEKIIAIMQGRSYFVWDVKPSWWASTLSRYVARTPAGIGLGDPVTMQLAIQEAGLPRVLLASAAGAAGKLVRKKGLFYQVVGGNVRAIDGPTEYSVYPANVSAKLPPKDPDAVAAHLNDVIRAAVPERWRDTFAGTVVMDANDIGRNTLGQAAPLSATHYELQFADNPLGQGREQTPMAIVFER